MGEAVVSGLISLVALAISYGALREKVKNNKQISDDRYALLTKELDALKVHLDDNNEMLTELKVTLSELKSDSKYIRETLREIKDKDR